MKIPKTVIKNNRKYTFVNICSNNMFLYENEKTKAKETFTKYDLGLIDNSELDKKLEIKNNEYKILVYDRLFDKEKIYNTIYEAANDLNCSAGTLANKIRHNQWLQNRWFVERMDRE